MVTERTTLAAELQAVMAMRGATEWSKILDVDRTTVHKWWAGDAYPRGRQLEAIARETGRQLRFVEPGEALPAWAAELAKSAAGEAVRELVSPETLQAVETLRAQLEALRPPSDEAAHVAPESQDRDG